MRVLATIAAACALGAGLGTVAAAPPGPRPAEGEARVEAAPEHDDPGADPAEKRPDVRRPPERPRALTPAQRAARNSPFTVQLRSARGCRVQRYDQLTRHLLALENRSEVLSLEVWGDAKVYVPMQKVLFHMRAPLASYVTLYWIGPDRHLVVPVENLRIPAGRNVTVDTGGYIAPPLGHERWVAVATLEPAPLGCGSEAEMIAALKARLALPHAIGRWEVVSRAP